MPIDIPSYRVGLFASNQFFRIGFRLGVPQNHSPESSRMANQIKKQTEDIEKLLARLSAGQNPKRPLSMHETAKGLTASYLNGLAYLMMRACWRRIAANHARFR